MIFWIWLVTILAALVQYMRQVYSRFSRYGVKHFIPLPFLGNFSRVLFHLEHFAENVDRTFNAFPGERFVGRFDFMSPMIVVRDLELAKKVTVKDFDHFTDHRIFIDKKIDALFGRNLLALKGEEWKDMRSTLSPAFTSSKIRLMVPFMIEVGSQMTKALKDKIQSSKDGYIDIDAKDLSTRYANDVIASCAFGLQVDSHSDEQNLFYANGKQAATFEFQQILKIFAYVSFPKIMNNLKVTLFPEQLQHFFRNLVMSTIRKREENHVVRPDMIHLLMEAKKGKLLHENIPAALEASAGFAAIEETAIFKKKINKVWSDDDVVAQVVVFFIAGFETASTVMSFLMHELAVNPDVQKKLVQEIREYDAKNEGKFDYNSIHQMTYMDMVVSEVLRMWPPAIASDRVCTKDYNLGKPNKGCAKDYIIRKGEGLIVPIRSFHHNHEFYPDPERFDPERFSEKNKHSIKPFTYVPFGLGPRHCIASRFALSEVKVMAYQLLRSVELSPSSKTQIPAQLSRGTFHIEIDGGHWIRLKARN